MYGFLIAIILFKICSAAPTVPTSQLTIESLLIIGSVIGVVLGISVVLNIWLYFGRDHPQKMSKNTPLQKEPSIKTSNFGRNVPSLEVIIQDGRKDELRDFGTHRRDEFNLHKAVDWACQYYQCELLRYLDGLVQEGDDIMERTLDQQVRKITTVRGKDVELLKQLVLNVIHRTVIDTKLLFWAIHNSPLKVVNILLVNKLAYKHINLDHAENDPSPIMACFQRPNLKEAEDILLHLWSCTIKQPCNVDPQMLKDAVKNWGTTEREPEKGGVNEVHIKSAIISKIVDIEAEKEKNASP